MVADEDSRLCLTIEGGRCIACEQVIQVLRRLIQLSCVPCSIRSDNGPECLAQAGRAGMSANSIGTMHIEPGKPWQNGAVESCTGCFRDECLHIE